MANAPQKALDSAPLSIVPPANEQLEARASFEGLWRELVETKAKLAMVMNTVAVQARAMEDLEVYCRRHVKRVDAIASRISKAAGA